MNQPEKALEELSHKRKSLIDLALYIWYSTGTVATLLQEIINIYQLRDHFFILYEGNFSLNNILRKNRVFEWVYFIRDNLIRKVFMMDRIIGSSMIGFNIIDHYADVFKL